MRTKITILLFASSICAVYAQEKIQTEIGHKNDFVYSNGNIGIGTSSPDTKLHVETGYIKVVDDLYNEWFLLKERADGTQKVGFKSDQNANLSFFTNNKEALRISRSGWLGIGTTVPRQKLSILDGQIYIGNTLANQFESGRIRFSEHRNSYQGAFLHYNGNSNTFNLGVHDSKSLISTNDLNAISITRNNAFVGIRTTNPRAQLDVKGAVYGEYFHIPGDNYSVNLKSNWLSFNGNSISYINATNPNGSLAIRTGGTNNIDLLVTNDGKVGIGTTTPDAKLTVAGNIHAQEVKVTIDAGADFVFEKNYQLPSLKKLRIFLKENKHLPQIAPAKEMETNGILLSEMNIKLLQKIEELTLYTIDQELKIEIATKKSRDLELRLQKLEHLLLK